MSAPRLELVRACTGDDMVGHLADCCREAIRSGEVLFFRAHSVYPLRVHMLCIQRATERGAPDLVEYPTIRAARLHLRGRLPAHRSGVMLREPAINTGG